MKNEKPYKQLFKETFTKTFGERYTEFSNLDKIAYWIFIAFIIAVVIYMFCFR
ncbi:hypothetical protein [Undibacterium sp. CCC3.4]|uniref:hypothetical protein n=1 Tax=Undibacterium sp. CCC3.4 TaxID=3048609 RepID=UPI002B222FCF|nr:hypothetical protein [Undibacterium sp. CCC3.4]